MSHVYERLTTQEILSTDKVYLPFSGESVDPSSPPVSKSFVTSIRLKINNDNVINDRRSSSISLLHKKVYSRNLLRILFD